MRIAALLVLCGVLSAQDPSRDVLDAGIRLYKEGDHEGAAAQFARARGIAPRDWRGHAWQALAFFQQAAAERGDPARRAALAREGQALTGPLVKEAGVLLQDPLRHYLLGLAASVLEDREAAL
ncbi:MAG: hypothetical protein L0177_17800, partial [Chloroflexi bacterium]|nr:hypothetical protein [Chloroflexota bacterium]